MGRVSHIKAGITEDLAVYSEMFILAETGHKNKLTHKREIGPCLI